MAPLFLLALIGSAVLLLCRSDARRIRDAAQQERWSVLGIQWTPFARWWASRRGERRYWLSYRDPSGRVEKRLCRVGGLPGLGLVVDFEPVSSTTMPGAEMSRSAAPAKNGESVAGTFGLGRIPFALVCAAIGGFVGTAAGIGCCLLLFPSSNIAPAYGVLFVGPLGGIAGAVFGLLRRA